MLRRPRILGTFLAPLFLGALCGLLCLLPCRAQIPIELPTTSIVDQARRFAEEPGTLANLEAAFRKIEDDYHFPVRVFLCDSLIGSDSRAEALRLQQMWFPQGDGWVIVAEMDSSSIGFGQPFLLASPPDPKLPPQLHLPNALSQVEQDLIIRNVIRTLRNSTDRDRLPELLCRSLAGEIDAAFRHRTENADSTVRLRVQFFAIGLAATAILIALLVWKTLQHADQHRARRYRFPEIQVASRLGAPYGGGRINSRNFQTPPPPP